MKRIIAIGLAIISLIMFGACAKPKIVGDKIILKAAHSVSPSHPYHLGLVKFSELVKERTGGKVDIDIFGSAQLGNERDTIEGLQLGTVDIAVSSIGPMGTFVKDFKMLDLPYLFEDYETADAVLDGEIGTELLKKLDGIGIVGGAFWENGYREITSSKKWGPIEKVDDIKGFKIRTQENEIHLATYKALGADPTPMAYSEVFTSLQSGVLDGQENPIPVIYTDKLFEVQGSTSMTNMLYSPALILFSQSSLGYLDDNTKQILLDCSKEAAKYERQMSRKQAQEQISLLEKEGMRIIQPDITEFKNRVKPVYKQFESMFDKILLKKIINH